MTPNISRRAALRGIASIPALGGATAALSLSTSTVSASNHPDAGIFALVAEWDVALAELKEAQADLDWLVADWTHLWPLAPEEILGCANGDHIKDAERDIAGRPMYRETADLTKRLSKEFRQRHARTCFSVDTAEEHAERLTHWRKMKSRARTPNGFARDARNKARMIAEYEEKHRLALQYEAETARLRELSGVATLHANIGQKWRSFNAIEAQVLTAPAKTVSGLAAKANVYVTSPNSAFMGRMEGHNVLSAAWMMALEIRQLGGVS